MVRVMNPFADDRRVQGGTCSVCGHHGNYLVDGRPTRENFQCGRCKASLRYRHQADALLWVTATGATSIRELAGTPELRRMSIYEPGIIGPFRRYLAALPSYTSSYYWEDLALGAEREGVRCENLEALTFADEAFDLVISSDMLEHVRHPDACFAEIRRVLRVGGSHVFTVPFQWPLTATTVKRVDVSGPTDVHILPPVFHRSPIDPAGSLVYSDFGMDLPHHLGTFGYEVVAPHGFANAITLIARRR